MEAVKVLLDELGISLSEADKIVLNAKAWEEKKENTLKVRDNFEKGISE